MFKRFTSKDLKRQVEHTTAEIAHDEASIAAKKAALAKLQSQVTGASIRHENESADVMNNMFKRSRQKKS